MECNVTLVSGQYPNCVPLNLFGRGNASQAAIDWVTGYDPGVAVTTTPYYASGPQGTFSYIGGPDKVRDVDIQQANGELVASGDIYKGWGAGAVSMAFGATYRREALNQVVFDSQGNPSTSPNVFPVPANNAALGIRGTPPGAANNSVDTQFSKVPFVVGGFNVKEVFTEAEVPLISNTFLLQQTQLQWRRPLGRLQRQRLHPGLQAGSGRPGDSGCAPARDRLPRRTRGQPR